MAVYADRVVTELVADTTGHDVKIRTSAQVVEQASTQIVRSANRAEASIRSSNALISRSFDQTAIRSRLLGYQIADVGAQLAAGTNPFLIIAQQAPQMANALDGATGVAGRMATFFSGPWGAAMLAAGSVLAILALRNRETSDTVETLTDKLEENARKAELTRQAQEAFARTLPGVIQRIREETEALESQNRSLAENQQLTLNRARQNAAQLERERNANVRAQAEAIRTVRALEGQLAASGGDPRATGPIRGQLEAARAELQRLVQMNAAIQSAIAAAQREIGLAEIPIARRQAEELVDPIAGINAQYDEMARAAERAAQGNRELARSLTQTLAGIERQRRAALEAEQERQRAGRQGVDGDLTRFNLPVQGRVTSGVGPRGGRQHSGVDIAVPVGTRVGAAAGGVVIETGNLPGYGNTVIIDHGRGTITRYAHLSQILAQRGTTVEQGDVIGLSGGARGAPGAGNSRGPHLHYEVRRSGRAVNPLAGQFPTDAVTAGGSAASARSARVEPSDFMSPWVLGQSVAEMEDLNVRAEEFLSTTGDLSQLLTNMPGLDEVLTWEAAERLLSFSEQFGENLARGLADAIVEGESLGDTLVDALKRAAAALIESQLLSLFMGGGMAGGPIGAVMQVLGIPGLASGGSFMVGGLGGIDRNVLSINGRPRARVSNTETVAVIPQGHALGAGVGPAAMAAPTIVKQFNISVSADHSVTPAGFARGLTEDILQKAARMDAQTAAGTIKAVPGRLGQFSRDGR